MAHIKEVVHSAHPVVFDCWKVFVRNIPLLAKLPELQMECECVISGVNKK